MSLHNSNCFVCGQEYSEEELHSVALSSINVTRYKICNSCIDLSSPANDYEEVRGIVDSYLKFSNIKIDTKSARLEQIKNIAIKSEND